jgi:hypothetical protein
MKADKKATSSEEKKKQNNSPKGKHSSQGHSTDSTGSATNTQEPTLRSATTDSSRSPKSKNDDLPTGGNIR